MGKEAFRTVFKSITADNGSEFLDRKALERSVSSGSRAHIYYAHPYFVLGARQQRKCQSDHQALHSQGMRHLEVYPQANPEDRGLDKQLSAQDIGL